MIPTRRIVICGGGTAGWITANLFAHRWPGMDIALVESPEIGTIGVGEGSTPSLKRFFEVMDIPEADWMPRCNATWKTNIRFAGWSPESGAADYSHPFTTQLDIHTADAFYANCRNRRMGHDVPTAPARFFDNAELARQGKAPLAPHHFPFRMEYGYHFDAALLGEFLRKVAMARGVAHRPARIIDAVLTETGDIASVLTDTGETIAGDLFVDCSGFAALLIEGKLGVGFTGFADNLFNDAAVVLPTAMDRPPPVETLATALSAGWVWQIPLTNRFGNGYVYSTAHSDPDQAEAELRTHLGRLDDPAAARHLRFRVGQRAQHWQGNVLAVGLAQGFIEPLEATAIHLVLNTVEQFMGAWEKGGFTVAEADDFNARLSDRIERVRDYVVAHYKLNTRSDTAYWRDNRDNTHLSDNLLQILDVWFRRGNLAAELDRQAGLSHFGKESWHCLLAGYGTFPPLTAHHRNDVDFHAARGLARFLDGCARNFPMQADALRALATH